MATQIKLRRDTAANWSSTNPVLGLAEPGYDTTNSKLKIGDGTTAWNLLPYFDDKVTDYSAIATDVLPDADNTRNIGSPDKRWQHGYFASGSLYIGDIKLSNNAGQLVVQQVTDAGLVSESPVPDTPGVVTTDRIVNGGHTITMNATGDFIPNSDILQDLGSPTNRFRHVYVGPGSVYIGNNVITESATGGLVLPGVTRATGYYAEEVDDEDDWGTNPTITGTVTVIDATRYQILAGQNPSANYNPATYTVQKDGNKIDEINVNNGGSGWTKAEADYARNNNMYATNVADAINNFNPSDWQQIPFRVEIKAEDTEYEDIFGGGTPLTVITPEDYEIQDVSTIAFTGAGVTVNKVDDVTTVNISGGGTADLGKFKIYENFIGTTDDDEGWGGYTMYLSPNGEGSSYIGIPTDSDATNDSLILWNNQAGGILLGTANNGEVRIQTDGNDNTWTFKNDGTVEFPGLLHLKYNGSEVGFIDTTEEGISIGGALNKVVAIQTDNNADNELGQSTWLFKANGSIEFPDGSLQTTAYTGGEVSQSVPRSDTAPISSDGHLWFNTEEGRMYIMYNEQWVDASPTVLTPPETDIDVNSITFSDATVLTTAPQGDRLANGVHEVTLASNGVLRLADDLILPRTSRWIKDCEGSGDTTSMRWYNVPTDTQEVELFRVYTDEALNDEGAERAKISLEWQNTTVSGLSITSFDRTDGVTEHKWNFLGDGSLKFPGQSDYRIREDEPGLVVTSELGFAVVTNSVESAKSWIFGSTGTVTFPDTTVQSTAYRSGQQTVNVNAASTSTAIELTALTGTVIVIRAEEGYTATGEYHNIILPTTEDIALGTRITVINQYNGTAAVSGWPGPGYELLAYQSMDLVYYYEPGLPGNLWWVVGSFSW